MRTSTKFLCISAVLVIVALAMAPVVTRAVVPDLDVDPMFFEEDDTVLVQLNDPGAKGKPAADEQTQSQTQTTAPTSQSDTQTKSVPTDVEAKPEAGAPAPTAPTPSPPVESPPTEVKPEAEAPSSTPPSSTPPSPKPVLTKCKDPAYRGQNPDGSPKKRVGEVGVACQKTTVPCTGGRFEPGLCGGPNDLQCCLKTAAVLKNSAAALKEAEAKKHAHASLEQKRQASEEHAKSSSASNAGRKAGSAVGSLTPKDSVKETTPTKETSVKPPPSSEVPPPSTSVKGALKGVQAVAKGKLGKVRMPTDLKTAKATPATELIANNMPGAMCQSFMQGSCVMKSTCASGNYATDSTMCPSRTQAPVCCFDKDIAGMPETPKVPPALVPTECPSGRTLCFLTADTVLTVTDGKVALDPSKVAQVKTAPLTYPDGSIITITDVKAAIEANPLVFGEGGVPAQVARITTKWTVTKKGTAFTDAKQTVFEEPDDVFYIDAAPKGVSGRVVGGMALQNLEQVFTVSPKGIVLKPGAVLTTPINVRTATVKVLGLVEGSSSYQKDRFAYEAKVRLEIVEPLLGFDAVYYGHNHIVKLTKGAIFTTEFAISSENLSAAAPSAASSPSTASPSAAAPPKRKVF